MARMEHALTDRPRRACNRHTPGGACLQVQTDTPPRRQAGSDSRRSMTPVAAVSLLRGVSGLRVLAPPGRRRRAERLLERAREPGLGFVADLLGDAIQRQRCALEG